MSSLFERFTAHSTHILQRAEAIATHAGAAHVEPTHLLLALALERGSLGAEILAKVRVQTDALRAALHIPDAATRAPVDAPTTRRTTRRRAPAHIPLDENTRRCLEKAALVAATHGHRYIGSEHVLSGLLAIHDSAILRVLQELRIEPDTIAPHLANVLTSTSKFPEFTAATTPAESAVSTEQTQAAPPKTPALDFFAKDLTAPTVATGIDPVIGREAEIERVIQILCRRTKNNPILVGDPGVGKTAIVEGLARKILERDVPDILAGKRILALDLALVVSGTIYRGEFESRLKQILDEVRQDTNLILFIDEIHTIMGAGAASGSLDAANILKPALARGEIRCIGATTYDEFKKHVENDPALERRFQLVQVSEPSAESTTAILRGLKPYYEQFHRVGITEEAIAAAVRFAERYLPDRKFPDKAIDLIDEAAARLRVLTKNDPLLRKANALTATLEQIDHQKRAAVAEERYADAARFQEEHATALRELTGIHAKLRHRKTTATGHIRGPEVAAVVAQILKMPVEDILLEEHERFRTLDVQLRDRIVGQAHAVTAIAHALQRAKSGLAAPNRPLASFLLLGPTGVGKTETAKALAQLLFQREDALIRLDMSEFSEGFTVSKLVGAPAGYVGYREGSKLTDTIRKKPASIVLFDEIEKAHPDVWNLLLQILEDGRLTDATGRESRFTNAVIVLTSNVGSDAFTRASIGFHAGTTPSDALASQYTDIRQDALRELRNRFRPELLNRIDETIVYLPLRREDLATITEKHLHVFAERLQREHQMTLDTPPETIAWIAERAFDPAQGARAVRRLLHTHVENPIASGILEERFHRGDHLVLAPTPDGQTLDVRVHAAPKSTRHPARSTAHA
ncbi:ATP-dependent Clp protease ATP-binding subunit [Candidatus Uhrbacteria bacterium]|nr:ATP-dependent Clp protease ATP-binding subunit [Candidatus Uhrbacteria bacterium]